MSTITFSAPTLRLLKGGELRRAIANYIRLSCSPGKLFRMYLSERERETYSRMVVPEKLEACTSVTQREIWWSLLKLHRDVSCRRSCVRNVLVDMREGNL